MNFYQKMYQDFINNQKGKAFIAKTEVKLPISEINLKDRSQSIECLFLGLVGFTNSPYVYLELGDETTRLYQKAELKSFEPYKIIEELVLMVSIVYPLKYKTKRYIIYKIWEMIQPELQKYDDFKEIKYYSDENISVTIEKELYLGAIEDIELIEDYLDDLEDLDG